jgi:hypothetical protein
VIDVARRQIKLVIMLLDFTAAFGAPTCEDPQQAHAAALKE